MCAEVLLIGSGGREHALAWKLSQSPSVNHISVALGNAGTHAGGKISNIVLDVKNHAAVIKFCKSNNVNLVVVGPEDPLANGLVDSLADAGVKCFGPKKKAAQIEASKEFAKSFMDRHNIPTARWRAFTDANEAKDHIKNATYDALVIKASGLAAGKGVVVCSSKEEAVKTIDVMKQDKSLSAASETIVVEELLEGEEVSVLCFTDGSVISVMPPSQDHKRLLDGDQGPNTGGMGAYCRCPQVSNEMLQLIKRDVLQNAVNGMKSEGFPFVGTLYAGLMLTKKGPKVLEFNCRFGDPETQVILPLLKSNLYEIMLACVDEKLSDLDIQWDSDHFAVGIVVVSGGYPGSYPKGKIIQGLDAVTKEELLVFHAGTALQSGNVVTSGGRVLAVVSVSDNLLVASQKAEKGAKNIQFDGAFHRQDIAHKAIKRLYSSPGMTYESCGVNITKADSLVPKIKALAKSCNRPGVAGSIGGFGGLFDLKAAGYTDPYLVSGTDGVGTKLKIAQQCNKHDNIGIDLVAMCVNDILTQGAEPLFFLDYFACGKLETNTVESVVSGIVEGCKQANCALVGGETAEMPGMYSEGEYDLAGFSVGAVEKADLLPKTSEIIEGDVVIGVPSSGIHSNGYSLVRKLIEASDLSYKDAAPFDPTISLGDVLLTPTKIYVKSVLPVMKKKYVKAAAHITGGGLTENIPRVLSSHHSVVLDASKWQIPPVLKWIAAEGHLSENEMLRTFNCGIGMILVVKKSDCDQVINLVKSAGEDCYIIGSVCHKQEGDPQVVVKNFALPPQLSLRQKRKVGVLISGSGTNLQALIDYSQNPSNRSAAEIVLVISNVAGVEGLKRAEKANIPTKVINHKEFKSRVEFDMAVHKQMKEAGVEIICLAGFMRIVSEEFVRLWQGHLLNIHPSLLPAFKGTTNAHKQVLEAGARITGCTVHFVEPEVDAGAIIEQDAIRVDPSDTVKSLQEKVKCLEHQIYPKALELLARRKIARDSDGKLKFLS